MLRALALFLFMCGQGVAVVKRRAQPSKEVGQVGFSGQGSSSMGVISADRLEQRPDLQGALALLPLQPGDATSAVSVLVLLQQAVLSAHSEVRATRGFERFAEAAEVAGQAAHRESEDLDANLVGVPVSLLSSAVDGPAGELLGPQKGTARAALARETELVRSVATRRQVAKHVQEANSLLSQPKANDTVAKAVRVSGAWLQSKLLNQGRHGVFSAQQKLTPALARRLAEQSKAPSFVAECKALIKAKAEPVEQETEKLCEDIQKYAEGYVACMRGKTDDSDAEFKTNDVDEEACKRDFPTRVPKWKGAFEPRYGSVPDGEGKDKNDQPARLQNYAKLALGVPGGWGSIAAETPSITRKNSVLSGFTMKIAIKFTNGWSISFMPVSWESLRFNVHDNMPTTPYHIGKDSKMVQGDDVKFWKLNKIWEGRNFAPDARFQFFGLTHPVNDGLALDWSFRRSYVPFPAYSAMLKFKFPGATTRKNIQTSVYLGSSVYPFSLSTMGEDADLYIMAGISYGVSLSSGPWTKPPQYSSGLYLSAGVSKVVNSKYNYLGVGAFFSLEPFKMSSIGLQILHYTESFTPPKDGRWGINMGFGTPAQFGWESQPKPRDDAIILAWNFFKDVLFDNDNDEKTTPAEDDVLECSIGDWLGCGINIDF